MPKYETIGSKEKKEKVQTPGVAEPIRRADELTAAQQPVQVQQTPKISAAPSQQLSATAQQQAVPKSAAAPVAQQATPKTAATPAVQEAQPAAAQQPPSWGGGYEKEIDDLYAQITGRQPFNYNINEDELWNSLKDDYRRMGQDAMKDTMGQAAGLTGGYGSSYGQAAGQAAYDKYLTELSALAPELQDRAYQRYKDEGDEQYRQLQALQDRDATAYGRYRDKYDRFLTERAYGDSRADLEYQRQREEQQYQDEKDRYEQEYADKRGDVDYERRRYEQEYADKRGDVDYERRQYDKEYADKQRQQSRSYVIGLLQYGYTPTDEDLEAAGMTREEADEMARLWGAENPDLAYRIGKIDAEEYKRMTGKYPAGYGQEGGGGGGGGYNPYAPFAEDVADFVEDKTRGALKTLFDGESQQETVWEEKTGEGNPYDYLSTMPTSAAQPYLESMMAKWDTMTAKQKTQLQEAAKKAGLI